MIIIAHRGASGYVPGNTARAFELAVKTDCDHFELDLHMTRDGRLVAHHDYDLKGIARTSAKIGDMDFAEIKKANPEISSVEEILDVLEGKARLVNFEIKNDGRIYPGAEEAVLSLINARKIKDISLVSSFDYSTALKTRDLDPGIRIGYLERGLTRVSLRPAVERAKRVKAESFHFNKRIASASAAALLKESGFKTYAYTVNDASEALKLEKYGVDGVFSDFPDLLKKDAS